MHKRSFTTEMPNKWLKSSHVKVLLQVVIVNKNKRTVKSWGNQKSVENPNTQGSAGEMRQLSTILKLALMPLRFENVRICIRSRPFVDAQASEPLWFYITPPKRLV